MVNAFKDIAICHIVARARTQDKVEDLAAVGKYETV